MNHERRDIVNMDEPITVLVADDSLFMRNLITNMIDSDPELKVIDTAKNGEEALHKISELKPDVVTLDIMMPGWDGLKTLAHIMDTCPVPVIILSAYSREGADITMKCLSAGAVGFLLKPSGEISLDIGVLKTQLIDEIKAVSKADVVRVRSALTKTVKTPRGNVSGNRIVVMGASTGGAPHRC